MQFVQQFTGLSLWKRGMAWSWPWAFPGVQQTHAGPCVSSQPEALPESSATLLETLVLRLQKGDTAALEELIRQTQKLGYKLAFSLLQDRQLAEDALQDVYLSVYQSLGQLRDTKAFKGWFCRILTNHCHKIRRKRPTDYLEDLTPAQQPQMGSHSERGCPGHRGKSGAGRPLFMDLKACPPPCGSKFALRLRTFFWLRCGVAAHGRFVSPERSVRPPHARG